MKVLPMLLVLWGVVITCMVGLLVYKVTCCDCKNARAVPNESEAEKLRKAKILARSRRVYPYILAFRNMSALVTAGLVGAASWAAVETLIH